MDSSSMGSEMDFSAVRMLSVVFPLRPIESISSTPMKKGKGLRASQSRVTLVPSGRFSA